MTLGQHFIFLKTYEWAQCAKVLVPGKSFLPSLMFASKPSGAQL